MNRMVFICFFATVGFFIAPQVFSVPRLSAGVAPTDAELEHYRALNEAETRLSGYKDDDSMLILKLIQLSIINDSRKQFGAAPVQLDILASRVANRQAEEAAKNAFHGHYNLAGEKPYMRYAFAGGVDHVSENAASKWSSADLDPSKISVYMRESHGRFMAEVKPNDGHLVNVINRMHTHVGLGVAIVGKQFRYYEEYIDRYLVSVGIPDTVSKDEEFSIEVFPAQGLFVYAVIAYYEPVPVSMSVARINSFSYYTDYTTSKAVSLWPKNLETRADGSCSVPLKFTRSGLYYVQIYLDTSLPGKTGSYTTSGKIQASGIVIRVP